MRFIDGADELEQVLMDELVKPLEEDDFLFAFDALRNVVGSGFMGIFESKVDSGGGPWPEHAPATVAMYGPHPLLRLTNTMYTSLVGDQSDYHIHGLDTGKREFYWGTTVEYAFAQNFGWEHIPQREFCYWSDTMKDEAVDVIEWYVDTFILDKLVA